MRVRRVTYVKQREGYDEMLRLEMPALELRDKICHC